MRANTHIQTTMHCARVRRRGRAIRSDSIRTPPSEESTSVSFYTRGAKRELGLNYTPEWGPPLLHSRFNVAANCVSLAYCLP
jgi:hypothetical protein